MEKNKSVSKTELPGLAVKRPRNYKLLTCCALTFPRVVGTVGALASASASEWAWRVGRVVGRIIAIARSEPVRARGDTPAPSSLVDHGDELLDDLGSRVLPAHRVDAEVRKVRRTVNLVDQLEVA